MATKPSLLLKYYQTYAPQCYATLLKIQKAIDSKLFSAVLNREYPKFEKVSVDLGLFVKLPPKSQWELPTDMGWIDVGTWELLYHGLEKDHSGNVVIGDFNLIDTTNSLLINHDKKVIGIVGVKDSIVVNTENGLLVCLLSQAARVKDLYNQIYK